MLTNAVGSEMRRKGSNTASDGVAQDVLGLRCKALRNETLCGAGATADIKVKRSSNGRQLCCARLVNESIK